MYFFRILFNGSIRTHLRFRRNWKKFKRFTKFGRKRSTESEFSSSIILILTSRFQTYFSRWRYKSVYPCFPFYSLVSMYSNKKIKFCWENLFLIYIETSRKDISCTKSPQQNHFFKSVDQFWLIIKTTPKLVCHIIDVNNWELLGLTLRLKAQICGRDFQRPCTQQYVHLVCTSVTTRDKH